MAENLTKRLLDLSGFGLAVQAIPELRLGQVENPEPRAVASGSDTQVERRARRYRSGF